MKENHRDLTAFLPADTLRKIGVPTEKFHTPDASTISDALNKLIVHRKNIADNISGMEVNMSQMENEFFKKQSGMLNRMFTGKDKIEELGQKLDEYRNHVNEVKNELELAKLKIDALDIAMVTDSFLLVADHFNAVCLSEKIWDILYSIENADVKSSAKKSIDRREVKFSIQTPEYIQSAVAGLHMEDHNGDNLYLFPSGILIENKLQVRWIDLKSTRFEHSAQGFLEDRSIPSDSKIVDHTWIKVNKDGSPDMRFKGNRQIPIVRYARVDFTCGDIHALYDISNFEAGNQFGESFSKHLYQYKTGKLVSDKPHISAEYFASLKMFSRQLVKFIERLKSDSSFTNYISQVAALQGLSEGPAGIIQTLFQIDLVKCFNAVGDLNDFQRPESFALLYVQATLHGADFNEYGQSYLLYQPSIIDAQKKFYETLKEELAQDPGSDQFYKLGVVLNNFNKALKDEYLTNLYQFVSIVIKADGTVTPEEEQVLKTIMKLPANSTPTIDVPVKVQTDAGTSSLEDVLNELDHMIGLADVKKEVNSLANFVRIQQARESAGLKGSSISYHIVFTGNPGTGKTTVARIMSRVYQCLGVLKTGHVVETDRSGLVAEYVGQTAIKANKTIDSALNGVLFIDEAYSLAAGGDQDFGKEAVATLIKRMEDNRDKLVVILAGYSNEMKSFIDMNPGIKSRFNRFVNFTDYTPTELLEIYEMMCRNLDYSLSDDARARVAILFTNAFEKRDQSFGNGRFARNVFEKTLENQANRLASVTKLDKQTLTAIIGDDIPSL